MSSMKAVEARDTFDDGLSKAIGMNLKSFQGDQQLTTVLYAQQNLPVVILDVELSGFAIST